MNACAMYRQVNDLLRTQKKHFDNRPAVVEAVGHVVSERIADCAQAMPLSVSRSATLSQSQIGYAPTFYLAAPLPSDSHTQARGAVRKAALVGARLCAALKDAKHLKADDYRDYHEFTKELERTACE